jgi:uncharacterized protein
MPGNSPNFSHGRLPDRAGAGFKPQHFSDILADLNPPAFFEIHAENYMGAGGVPHRQLAKLRESFAISLHGVGLSIGAMQDLDRDHLARLRMLCERYQPESFSEHLAWSSHGEVFLNDLLPLPYTEDTLHRVVTHVDQTQQTLGRKMLLENPATYLRFEQSTMTETDFLRQVAHRTGCGMLLDLNNVFVSAGNHGFTAQTYLDDFPLEYVGEIHLAGHDVAGSIDTPLLIDAHGSAVSGDVWELYHEVVNRIGTVATLIEWDNDIPDWITLRHEVDAAERILTTARRRAA